MYPLSRMFTAIGVLLMFYCIGVMMLMGWPMSGAIATLIIFVGIVRRRSGRLTTLGSARWADEDDLGRAGMLGADAGLILGRATTWCSRKKPAFGKLFDLRNDARQVCREFWRGLHRGGLVRLPQAIHTAVFSPTSCGKGVSCVIPFLMTCKDSCVVIDFKGENAALTAKHRRKTFGHQIVLLDPFNVCTKTPDRFIPLDFIDKASAHALDECNDLAKALVVRNPDEREPHWNDSAEAWIAAMVATVVQYGDAADTRSLQTVREFLSNPERLELAVKLMCESDAWGGMLSRMGGQLRHYVEKEKSSTLTTVSRHLRFLDSLAVAESTKTSTFDPAKLRSGKMTVYLILPPDHMRAQSPLLRVWIGALLRAVVAGGLQERKKVHFVLDEAASLGHLDCVDDAVDKYRGYGVRLQFYFQSLGQVKKCFPEGQEQTLLSNTSQIFFAVNDNTTAEFVSARLGESTIIVDSGGTSSGASWQSSQGAQPQTSKSYSFNSNANWQQQARKLLKPEEVTALSPRTAITFTPGMLPIATTLLRYYEEKRLVDRFGWRARANAALVTLAASILFCVGMGFGASALTNAINESANTPVFSSSRP